MNKKKRCVWLLINAIICYITAGFYLFATIAFACNLYGVVDLYNSMMTTMFPNYLGQMDMTMIYFEMVFDILLGVSFGNFYLLGYRKAYYSREYASRIMLTAVLQFLCGAYITGVIGIIIALVMKSKAPSAYQSIPVEEKVVEPKPASDISQAKLLAMTEAVERLKQLREKGVISEEEYYVNLNKILEG